MSKKRTVSYDSNSIVSESDDKYKKRVVVFNTSDDVSKSVFDFVNSGIDIEKGIYTGVTKVLGATADKSFLEVWRNRVGDEEADRIVKESQDIGNSLDELLLQSFLPTFDENDFAKELGFSLYKQLSLPLRKIEPIALQLKIWSEKYKIMGYLDCLGYYNGELSLIDFKNAKSFKKPEYYHDYLLQCTMYCIILKLLLNISVRQVVLLIGVRDSASPQIVIKRTKDYVKEALNRIDDYHAINDNNIVKCKNNGSQAI